MNTQLELEEVALSGALEKLENVLFLAARTAGNFGAYLTSKELKFIFSCIMESYTKYSGVLTEQYLSTSLTEKGASEDDILKYCYVLKKLRRAYPEDQNFKLAVDKLSDNFISRCLIDSMLQTQELLQRDRNGAQAFDLLDKNLMILKNQVSCKDIRETSTTSIGEEFKLYEDMRQHPEKYRGVKIGIDKLDEMTGGFRKGEFVIAMGATKVGKSIFLLNCQYNTMMAGYNSILFSIEMSMEQCRRRLASRITELPYMKIKNVHLTREEEEKLRTELSEFEKRASGHSLIVDVPENCTAKMIEAKARAMMKTQKVDLIIVDYLLLMSPSTASSKLSREERVTQIALELKQMARALNIPVLTATQVNAKAGEKREKTSDEAYDWVDASQAKSVIAHSDWVLSLKREPDTNILNLGITAGRDGALDSIIQLVTDYSKMALYNYVDVAPMEVSPSIDTPKIEGSPF